MRLAVAVVWWWSLSRSARVVGARSRKGKEGDRSQVVLSSDAAQFEGLGAALKSLVRSTARPSALAITVVVPAAELRAAERLARCALQAAGGAGGARVLVRPIESTNVASLAHIGYEAYGDEARAKAEAYGNLESALNYARFYLPDLVPRDATYLLYLDVDVVVRCDVVDFLQTKAPRIFDRYPNASIAAVDRDHAEASSHLRRRLLFPRPTISTRAFNAGVFVVDVGRWRARGATAALERAVADTAAALKVDPTTALWKRPSSQAPMLFVFGDDFAPLDACWNRPFHQRQYPPPDVDVFLRDQRKVLDDCVWHFTGPEKPWMITAPPHASLDHWARQLWLPHAASACVVQGAASSNTNAHRRPTS